MKNNTHKELFRKIKVLIVAVVLFFGLQGLFAYQTVVGPATLSSTVDAPIHLGSNAQIKSGKFGIYGNPPIDYNFIVKEPGSLGSRNISGVAMFKGGVRTGSAFFNKDVVVGSVAPATVSVYGDIKVKGNTGTVVNSYLQHNEPTPQPVCSDAQGVLTFCTLPGTN